MTRRALVVGCNYPGTAWELSGCVADAEHWADVLMAKHFAVSVLTNDMATQSRILGMLRNMVADSDPGDCVAYVYSGHGTNLRDPSGDEADGFDEAQCPIDFPSGAYLIDDDLRAVTGALPAGAGFVAISDSCFSATITRLIGRAGPGTVRRDARRRSIPATPEMHAAHARFRAVKPVPEGETWVKPWRPRAAIVGPDQLRSVSFSACKATEVAYEFADDSDPNGQVRGAFTMLAAPILAAAGATLTRAGYLKRILHAFGPQRDQTPVLDSAPGVDKRSLWSWTVAP